MAATKTPKGGGAPGRARGRAADAAAQAPARAGQGGGTATAVAETAPSAVPPRLKERYVGEIAPALREEFGLTNVMQIPTLTKIVVNMGVGEAARDAKLIEGAVRDLTLITGQKPAVARARKSIA